MYYGGPVSGARHDGLKGLSLDLGVFSEATGDFPHARGVELPATGDFGAQPLDIPKRRLKGPHMLAHQTAGLRLKSAHALDYSRI